MYKPRFHLFRTFFSTRKLLLLTLLLNFLLFIRFPADLQTLVHPQLSFVDTPFLDTPSRFTDTRRSNLVLADLARREPYTQKSPLPPLQRYQAPAHRPQPVPVEPPPILPATPTRNTSALQPAPHAVASPHANRTPPRFVLFRALGNDLPPRHAKGQTVANLKFILENEPALPQLQRQWYINRLVDKDEESQIIHLLKSHNQLFTVSSFNFSEFATRPLTFEGFGEPDILHSRRMHYMSPSIKGVVRDAVMHHQNLYVMHNNAARNDMLRLGLETGAEYILPWDGNCFVNTRAWNEIVNGIESVQKRIASGSKNISSKYFQVGMARMISNDPLKKPEYAPLEAKEEPQLIFHRSAKERFNENMRYGRRPKVELLWRLRVPGRWDKYTQSAGTWERKEWTESSDVPGWNSVASVGWVARLFSGKKELEKKGNQRSRGVSRSEGIETLLARMTETWARKHAGFSESKLAVYDEDALKENRELQKRGEDEALSKLVNVLVENATALLQVDYKTGFPGDDGHMLSAVSRDVPILTLAGFFTEESKYYERAVQVVLQYFVDERTRISTTMEGAGWRSKTEKMGKRVVSRKLVTQASGVVPLLDSLRILHRETQLDDEDMKSVKDWMQEFAEYMELSSEGEYAYYASDRTGTLYDYVTAGLYGFLGDYFKLLRHTSFARGRLLQQFSWNGALVHERGSKGIGGLVAWTMLADLSERAGVDVWGFSKLRNTDPVLKRGVRFHLDFFPKTGLSDVVTRAGGREFDKVLMLGFLSRCRYTLLAKEMMKNKDVPASVFHTRGLFDREEAAPPFWNLGVRRCA